MVRPCIQRLVGQSLNCTYYKPQGIPLAGLEEIMLGEDELEAVRLADVEGLYHDAAAQRMNVSRPTFGRILAQARRSVATAITQGKALRIGGGVVERINEPRRLRGGRGRCRRGWRSNAQDTTAT